MEILRLTQFCGVENILRSLNVPVRDIDPDNKILYEYERGATYKVPDKNKYSVYIRRDLTVAERQRVLCHELGHIALGHMTKDKFPNMTELQREKEANMFADFILPYIYGPVIIGGKNG